jgi:hypothetical protein
VLRDRGLCGLVCPSRTIERGGKGDCVKGGGGEEGERVKERALGRPPVQQFAVARFPIRLNKAPRTDGLQSTTTVVKKIATARPHLYPLARMC